MEITEVRVCRVDERRLKAFVTVTFDHCFVVRDIKVIDRGDGLFVAMPARRLKDGSFKDVAHPINAATRERLERAILAEYERQLQALRAAGGVVALDAACDGDAASARALGPLGGSAGNQPRGASPDSRRP